MSLLYLDCFGGASGDMILGALLDLGVPAEAVASVPGRLGLEEVEVRIEKKHKSGLACTDLKVVFPHGVHKGSFAEIRRTVEGGDLPEKVRERSLAAFDRLARAEGAIHGRNHEDVHFHEIGSPDTFVDIVGAMAALEQLGWPEVHASALPLGTGVVRCQHGEYPLPSPATLKLLEGVPVYQLAEEGERVTPTGAAILTTVVARFGALPPMTIKKTGFGMGDRETPGRPNVLRAVLGETCAAPEGFEADRVLVLECDVDDASPEILGGLFERALAAGALDLLITPVQMKKGRPGASLRLLAPEELKGRLVQLLFEETTTLGVRARVEERVKLSRRFVVADTEYGPIRVKVGEAGGRVYQISPEYEDCARAAAEHGVPLKNVYHYAIKNCKMSF